MSAEDNNVASCNFDGGDVSVVVRQTTYANNRARCCSLFEVVFVAFVVCRLRVVATGWGRGGGGRP